MTASTVYTSKPSNRERFTHQVLEIFAEPISKAKKVFIKPNIVSYEPYPTTTHPDVLEAILKHLSAHEILVGDAPAIDAGRANKILEQSPLNQVCEHHGIKLLNLYSHKMQTFQSSRGYKIKVSAIPLSCDYIISIPVLKIHGMVGLSGALKNQFGYLNRQNRLLMHCKAKNIHKGIAEANVAVPANLFIVDAVETMIKAQECRHGGCPAQLNTMIAGTDPVSLDLLGLELLKRLEPRFESRNVQALKHIKYALDYGMGKQDYSIKELP